MPSPFAPNAKRAKGATGSFATPIGSKTTSTSFAPIKPAPGITSSTYGAAQPTTGGGFGQSRHTTVTTQTPAFPNFIPLAGSNAYTGQSFAPPATPAVLAPTTVAPAPVPVGLFSVQPPAPAQVAAVPAVAQQLPPIGGAAAAQVIQQVAAVPSPAPVKLRQRQLGGQPDFSPAFELVKEPFSWWRSVGRIFSVGSSLALVSGLVLGTKTIAEYLFPASAVIQVLLRISGSIVGYRLLSWIGNWSNTTNAAVTKIARAANEQAADGRISAKSLKELQDLLDIYDASILKLENLLMELPKLNKDDVVITGPQYSQLLSLVTEIEMVLNTSDQITGTNHGGNKSAKLRELRDRYKDALLNTLQANPQNREEVEKAFTKLNAIPKAINANIEPSTGPIKPFQLPKPINQQILPQPARVTFQPRQLPPAPIPKPFVLPPINPQPAVYDRPTPSQDVRPKAPAKRKSQPKLKTSPRRAKPKGYTPKPRRGVSDGVKKRPYSPTASTRKAGAKKKSPSPRGAPKKRKAPSGSRAGDSPRSPGGRR